MEKKEFAELENYCQFRFMEAGSCFHVCSQENHPVLFHNEDEFRTAMNVVAFVSFLFTDIRIFTFEIMDNHFHFAMAGSVERIRLFVKNLVSKLSSHPDLSSSADDLRRLSFKYLPIDSLENMRNVIAYTNRNGAVVSVDENVFTYRWGANRFFFNREVVLRHKECGREIHAREKRMLFHSSQHDSIEGIVCVDGYVSPICFCQIMDAESFFRNSRHYFHSVSRNIESAKDIAKTIGENLFYSDEDLYSHLKMVSSKRYGCQSVSTLTADAKVELAKELRFDFNAGARQICRLLKMDISTVRALFPDMQ